MEFKREDIIWAAGLIEGEGCFTLHSKNHPYFLLDSTDEDTIDKLKETFPFTTKRGPYQNKKNHNNKVRWRVDAFGPFAYAIMVAVYPFMQSRRKKKIEDLIKIWKQN